MKEVIPAPRLGVEDKRHLFASLLAMSERLLMLNKFPVDMEDFALSMQAGEVENAWRLINVEAHKDSLSPASTTNFTHGGTQYYLHLYPDGPDTNYVFMNTKMLDISKARRHHNVVSIWCERQKRLEEQLLRSAKAIKAIVHSCNTVGQYKRVSPDLLTFLPEKYQLALRDYIKQSPYPAITVEPHEIDTMLSSLAFASLQPQHHSEIQLHQKPHWGYNRYDLADFPRSRIYDREEVRQLDI